jgi:Helix-turn-helix domain
MCLLLNLNRVAYKTTPPMKGASYAGRQARLRLSEAAPTARNILTFRVVSRKSSVLPVRFTTATTGTTRDLAIKIIEAVLDLTVGSSTDKLVLFVLANFADEDTARCWPSIATLCEKTELSARAINKSIARLKAAGHIGVIHRHRHSNIFTLHVVRVSPSQVHPYPAPGSRYPARRALRTVKDPSSEPSRNKSEDRLETAVDKIRSEEMMRIIRARQGGKL